MIKLPIIKPPIQMEPNATVLFMVPTGEFRIEKATRNKIPIEEEKTVKAWITEIGLRSIRQEHPGLDLTERHIRGYFLADRLPPGLRATDRVRIVLDQTLSDEQLILFFNETTTPLKDIVIKSLGIPFEGRIQAIGGSK